MPLRILLILGALSAFGALAIDFYLPSFPTLAKVFGTDIEHVQLSLASYFIGIALGQLIYGPLADRYGRRRPLIAGLLLFSVASLACALAPTLEWLIAARFVQALGGCAGMVISRAVVRDLCDPINTARVYSQLMLVVGVAPILAPLGGSLLLTAFGWPAIFLCLMALSVLCLLAIVRGLPESLPADALHPPLSGALGQYWRLLGDRAFMGHALSGGFGMAGMFAYVAGSPFVLIELYGVPPEHYGWVFGGNALGFILAAQLNSWLVRRHGPAFLLPRTICLYLLFALGLGAVALWQPPQLWVLMLPLFCCTATLGCIIPNATACAMAEEKQHAGSASALLGFVQFALAAIAASLVGALHDGTAFPVALVIMVCAAAALVCCLQTLRAPDVALR